MKKLYKQCLQCENCRIKIRFYKRYLNVILNTKLNLELHPKKVEIRKFRQGVDFLGYIIFPHYIILRAKTKRRIIKKIRQKIIDLKQGEITEESFNQTIQVFFYRNSSQGADIGNVKN